MIIKSRSETFPFPFINRMYLNHPYFLLTDASHWKIVKRHYQEEQMEVNDPYDKEAMM